MWFTVQFCIIMGSPALVMMLLIFGVIMPKVNPQEVPEEAEEEEFELLDEAELRRITRRLLRQPRRISYNPAYTKAGYMV